MHLLHTIQNNMFLDTSIIKSPFVTFYEFLILLKGVKWNLENEVFCRRALRLIFIFYSTMNSLEVKFKSEQLTISLFKGNNKSSAVVCGFLYISSFIVNPMTHRIREQTNNQTISRRKHNIITLNYNKNKRLEM